MPLHGWDKRAMCHVLVIEDEWFIAQHIADLAEDAGATSVVIASTEHEAVEAAHVHKPAIILSDVNLFEGTGPMAVSTIVGEHGPIPVIFITATPEDCRSCGPPNVVLQKPVNRTAVVEAFRQLAPV